MFAETPNHESAMRRINLKPGDVLFEKGDSSESAYLLLDGHIEISGIGFQSMLEKLEIFGEAGLVGKPRMATATARSDCRLLEFSVEELRNTIQSDPERALLMVEAMVRRLAASAAIIEKLLSQDTKSETAPKTRSRFGPPQE